MLKCQRNSESSFAVSASTCIGRKSGDRGERGIGGATEKDAEHEARTCARYVYAPALSAMLIPAIFN